MMFHTANRRRHCDPAENYCATTGFERSRLAAGRSDLNGIPLEFTLTIRKQNRSLLILRFEPQ
jgi:hypothetical protein